MKATTFMLMERDALEQMERIRAIKNVTLEEIKQAGSIFVNLQNAPEVSAIGKNGE